MILLHKFALLHPNFPLKLDIASAHKYREIIHDCGMLESRMDKKFIKMYSVQYSDSENLAKLL